MQGRVRYSYYPNTTLPTGYNWNASFYIKKAPGNTSTNNKIIAKEDLNGSWGYVEFNLDTGTTYIFNSSGINITGAAMTDEGNGWWRCSMSGDVLAGRTANKFPINIFRNGSNNGNFSFTGDTGAKYYIWGMQVTGTLNNVSGKTIQPYAKTTVGSAGNGFIVTWYDQSGNSRHASQPTAANQPYIVWEGAMLKNNGKATLKKFTTGLNSYGSSIGGDTSYRGRILRYPYGSFTITKPVSLFTVTRYNDTGNRVAVGGDLYSVYSPNYLDSITNGKFSIYTSGYLYSLLNANTNNNIKFMLYDGSNSKISVNNGGINSTALGNIELRGISIGAASGTPYFLNEFDGDIQEVIFWNSDKSSTRLDIQDNMNTYYSVY